MKIQRNALCSCGSGLKYKRCCEIRKSSESTIISISIEGFLSLIKFGLENVDTLADGARKVSVKGVSITNGGDTVLVEFYPQHSKSFDIKGEIGFIMGYLYGLLKGDPYKDILIKLFGVKAYDQHDNEIMYAVNTRTAVASITNGNSIEWLKTTLFQENTPDYRLARAKTMISDIENGLRKVINNLYESKIGLQWWDIMVESKVRATIKNTYKNQFGAEISDGKILINYAFTLDLKKIISADWSTFRHLFITKIAFENEMVELNVIRREEAHNRDITENHLFDLERIYNTLLGEIANLYPEVTVNYMVENWRSKIKDAMANPIGCVYTMDEFNKKDLEGKRHLIITDCVAQISYLKKSVAKLSSLAPPLAKRNKHQELINLLKGMADLQQLKLQRTQNLQFDDIQEIITEIQRQIEKMDVFSRDFLLQES